MDLQFLVAELRTSTALPLSRFLAPQATPPSPFRTRSTRKQASRNSPTGIWHQSMTVHGPAVLFIRQNGSHRNGEASLSLLTFGTSSGRALSWRLLLR